MRDRYISLTYLKYLPSENTDAYNRQARQILFLKLQSPWMPRSWPQTQNRPSYEYVGFARIGILQKDYSDIDVRYMYMAHFGKNIKTDVSVLYLHIMIWRPYGRRPKGGYTNQRSDTSTLGVLNGTVIRGNNGSQVIAAFDIYLCIFISFFLFISSSVAPLYIRQDHTYICTTTLNTHQCLTCLLAPPGLGFSWY